MSQRRDGDRETLGGKNRDESRDRGPTIDLEALEAHARDLYLHRFVAHIKKARGEHGRFLQLRPGDALAIKAADDESARVLDDVAVDPGETSTE